MSSFDNTPPHGLLGELTIRSRVLSLRRPTSSSTSSAEGADSADNLAGQETPDGRTGGNAEGLAIAGALSYSGLDATTTARINGPATITTAGSQTVKAGSTHDSQADAAGERDPAQLFVRPGLQQKHVRRLRRGQIPIEAEADLHGMRTREAEKVLVSFLRECRDQGLRCVRVIHGKGRGSRGGQAVLKWEVDRWLRRDQGVMAFSSAQPRDGGTGAVYVLLKR